MGMSSPNKKRRTIVTLLLAVLGFCLVAAGSFLLYVSLVPKKAVLQAPSQVASASIKRKTAEQKAAYSVPPTHPRELIIPKLNVDANVLAVGAPNSTMAAPASAWDVGWYDKSALPGSGSGALLIDGHVNDALNSPGIFYRLASLHAGDTLTIERGDGQRFTYSVAQVRDVPLGEVDMTEMLSSAEKGKEGLNLITCGGTYDSQRQTYDHRILVFAVHI